MTAPATQPTKEQWNAAFKAAYPLFLELLKLKSYVLEKPLAIFNLLVQYASQVGGLTTDPAQIAEAVHVQLLAHLLDRTSVGLQRQKEGRPLQMSDLVIRWTTPPPALTKYFPKAPASWINEYEEREKEAEEHLKYLEVRKDQEYWRSQCPGVISGFQPVRRGGIGIDRAAIQRVTATLQTYLDGYEKKHQEDLQAFEADRTFRGWRVNWQSVCARMEEFVDKQYNAVEGRTAVSERI